MILFKAVHGEANAPLGVGRVRPEGKRKVSQLIDPRHSSLTWEQRHAAWKSLGLFKLGPDWCHGMTGRVFFRRSPKAVWCDEMNERYGDD